MNVSVQAVSGGLQHTASIALQIQKQAFADFSVFLNDSQLTLSQGGSNFTLVGLNLGSSGSDDYEVQFTASRLPSGLSATFAVNPFPATTPVAKLTFAAGSTAALANYATVTVTAIRAADGAQRSAQLLVSVLPPQGSLPPIRSDFIRTDGTPAAAVFDQAHGLTYASNPQWNRVDVISPATHTIVNSVPAPSPTGMDLSLDGMHLLVGSNVQQIVSIDTSDLQVVNRTNVPLINGNASSAIPALLTNMANGTVLVGMTNNSSPPSYYLEQWNPTNGSFELLSAPGIGPWINQLVRTGDGAKALVVDYGSDLNVAIYDSASNSFTASGQSPVGQVFSVLGSPNSDRFAIVGGGGLAFVDSGLNTVGTIPLSGYFEGMAFSQDGTKIYITSQETPTGCTGSVLFYPVILTYDTNSLALLGVAPSFETSNGTIGYGACPPYIQALPLTADNNGLVYSSFSHGVVIEDASNYQNLLNLPNGPPFPQMSWTDEAPLNTALTTGLGQIPFDVAPDVWFGNTRGTNVQLTGPLVSVNSPPSPTPALVNVKAILPDGWFSLTPQSFSYGSQILFMGATAASVQGSAPLALFGYGLMGNNGVVPTVTIGGKQATVIHAAKYLDFIDSGYNALYPFQDVDEVLVTVPPGNAGSADVTVTSQAGSVTLANAFNYVQITDYSSSDALTFVLYDPQRHWVYLSAGDHIDVFSTASRQYLTPITPPSIGGARQIRGLALTPDNSKLLAANLTDSSVAIIDPDNPTSATAVPIPVSKPDQGVSDIVATSTGKAFVDGVFEASGCAGAQLWELDLTTLIPTLRTDLPFPGLQAFTNTFMRDIAGDEVLMGGTGCGTYLWSASTDKFVPAAFAASGSSTISGDGYWLANDYTRLDPLMIEHTQMQVPEFIGDLTTIDLPGEKMNASGSLLYTPVPAGSVSAAAESNGIYISDTSSGKWLGEILLTEQIPIASLSTTMDLDEADNLILMPTNQGLTVIQLPPPPLSIGYLNPASGPSAGGTSVTIRGSGFEPGAVASVGNTPGATTFVDANTLLMIAPAGVVGGARVTIQNPDGGTYFKDAGFSYQ